MDPTVPANELRNAIHGFSKLADWQDPPPGAPLREALEQADIALLVHGTKEERDLFKVLGQEAMRLLERPSMLLWRDWYARILRLLHTVSGRETVGTTSGEPILAPSVPKRPTMFLGSSTEGLAIAQAIQAELEHDVESTIWSQGVFGLSAGTLDVLVDASRTYQFAALILTPDDVINSRGWMNLCARDNVLFELGLFIGALGANRVFIVRTEDTIHLPSDIAGITPSKILRRSDGNLQAAVGPTCSRIRTIISSLSRA